MEGMEALTLPDALRQQMAKSGSTQAQAAAEIGTSQENVNRWIGGTKPKPQFYEQLCVYLDVSLEVLGGMIVRTELAKIGRGQL